MDKKRGYNIKIFIAVHFSSCVAVRSGCIYQH